MAFKNNQVLADVRSTGAEIKWLYCILPFPSQLNTWRINRFRPVDDNDELPINARSLCIPIACCIVHPMSSLESVAKETTITYSSITASNLRHKTKRAGTSYIPVCPEP